MLKLLFIINGILGQYVLCPSLCPVFDPPLIEIITTYYYCICIEQFYLDPIGYSQKVWNHQMYKGSLTIMTISMVNY